MTAALDPAVTNMGGQAALPRDNGALAFDAPWEGRSLAMAIALVDHLDLDWEDFRQRLIEQIAIEPDRPYYESWTSALESLAVGHDITDPDDLRRRAAGVTPPG